MTAMTSEANRLYQVGSSPEEITAALTETVDRALNILNTGIGNSSGTTAPS